MIPNQNQYQSSLFTANVAVKGMNSSVAASSSNPAAFAQA
jgi:hypothetical protein